VGGANAARHARVCRGVFEPIDRLPGGGGNEIQSEESASQVVILMQL
jgi:hypothetical protein